MIWMILLCFAFNLLLTSTSFGQDHPDLSNPIAADDFRIIDQYGNSFLAENSDGKRLLYLEGNPYERGYAEGYLVPKGAYRMAKEFPINFFKDAVEVRTGSVEPDWDALLQIMDRAVKAQEHFVPREYREEMKGIAEGASVRGYSITYDDVLILNVGIDFLLSIGYQAATLFCNQYMIFGHGTTDGRLFHGRDFMFSTGKGVLADEALIKVIKPNSGHTLVASAAPAMVGIPTGMNDAGISCGMDMVPSRFNRGLVSGMGVLLECRNVVQYADTVSEGTDLIRNSSRGVSWLYGLADGKKPDAVVLETVADSPVSSGEDSLAAISGASPELAKLIEETNTKEALVQKLDDAANNLMKAIKPFIKKIYPDRGVAVRTANYTDPPGIEKYMLVMPVPDQLINQKCETATTNITIFPPQLERKADLVAMTNHFILPQMNLSQAGLLYHTLVTAMGGGRESEWRYKTMIDNILKYYGNVDRQTAMWLIDFLNPQRAKFYGGDTTQGISGHHVLMDDQSLEMWSLHGYYNQPWEHVDLKWFLGETPEGPFASKTISNQ